MSHKMNSVRWP